MDKRLVQISRVSADWPLRPSPHSFLVLGIVIACPALAQDMATTAEESPAIDAVVKAEVAVADGNAEDGDETFGDDPGSSRAAAYQAFVSLYEEEDYEQALDAAALVIEFTAQELGPEAAELIVPLVNLASLQDRLDLIDDAESNYLRAIELVEQHHGIFAPQLVNPLQGLGVAYHRTGRFDEAISTLQRAKYVTHRNQGIMNLDQMEIIDQLAETYMGSREFRDADREQRFALRVHERRFGMESPDVVPGLFRIANWFKRTGQYPTARDTYRRALKILEESYGEEDLRLVEALHGIAVTYHLQQVRRGEGEKALTRAVEIYDATPLADVLDYAESLVSLGDWYIQTSKYDQAVEAYGRAWGLLAEEDGGSTDRARGVLGVPVRLRYSPPQPEMGPVQWDSAEFEQRFVDVEFTVSEKGRVQNATVVSANAPNRVKRAVRQAVMNARYRPRFVDGQAVSTPGVRLRQTFFVPE